jgi:seryl-tRNA synthetase
MLDIKTIRGRADDVRAALASRGSDLDITPILSLDEDRRKLVFEVEELKSRRNTVSKDIGRLKKEGQDISAIQMEMREVGEKISSLDERTREVEAELEVLLHAVPNMPHASVPVSPDATGNRVVKTVGAPVTFPFEPLPHWELGEKLCLFDLARGTRMSGSGFPLYVGRGARLERALIQFMLDVHTAEHGYTEVVPPLLCTSTATRGTGQLPKLADEMYYIPTDDLYLIPTGEVPVTNMFREEIIDKPLPLYYTTHTPCFRREAGAAGRETRGLIRVHQFDKVEMVKFVEPATSYDELEKLLGDAEDILQRLGLHYRVLELCTGDLSFAAAKCYDIELWAPAHGDWLEVSSCSNFEDFQARRAGIRYRDKDRKVQFVHTLNGSGVALARLYVAILENYQQEDGSVVIPEVLRPYMGGLEVLVPEA